MGVSENRGTLFWGPYNKDPTNLGYYIRVSYFRKLPDPKLQAQGFWLQVFRVSGLRDLGVGFRIWGLGGLVQLVHGFWDLGLIETLAVVAWDVFPKIAGGS